MEFSDLIDWFQSRWEHGLSSVAGVSVCSDSRKVKPGDVFVAIRGTHQDGHAYAGEAIRRGAKWILAERAVEAPATVEVVLVPDTSQAMGELAQAAYRYPRDSLLCLGVTGTNGKTTTAYLTRMILNTAGMRCGMIGTVEYDVGDCRMAADNTTPDSLRLAEMMGRMRDNGLKAMMMECSSHGLDQRRTAGIRFRAAAFTNLTGDHLDYHGTTEAYLHAKSRLFRELSAESYAILNGEDVSSEKLAANTPGRVMRYGILPDAKNPSISGRIEQMGFWGTQLELRIEGQSAKVRTHLVGRHNVSNILAAAGLAWSAGVTLESMVQALEEFEGVPGRLERVNPGGEPAVFVDYAHTDDALRNVLGTLRSLEPRRLILVFGCGGDRDRTKRPRMARAAEEMADFMVVTSDNPRTESPEQIFSDIRRGFSDGAAGRVELVEDRRRAIERAIASAQSGDVVLIAGKGHEDYQIVGSERRKFDDRHVARELLQDWKPGESVRAPQTQKRCFAGETA